ncbi:unnamed protein product [Tuber aestivum]|uniref:AAA+ ATPase domain-containing protein n=1 Tax=Tuber aestivum TaxID=59557 RepID=A0A292PXW2_9PEZI|nr:unnamed protein product [Tuber aestivum]
MMTFRAIQISRYASRSLFLSTHAVGSAFPHAKFRLSAVPGAVFHQGGSRSFASHAPKASEILSAVYRVRLRIAQWVWYGNLLFTKLKPILLSNSGASLIGLTLGTGSNLIYASYVNCKREQGLQSALALGSVPDVEGGRVLAERKEIKEALTTLLQPASDHSQYGMVIGSQGTGKTTLVRQVAHNHAGILYVNIQPSGVTEQEFAETVAKALHFFPRSRVWFNIVLSQLGIVTHDVEDKRKYLVQVFDEFTRQAKIYRQKTNRPPVLVLDNVNRLAAGNPGLLNILQDIAKDAADDGIFITVFVASEGQAPLQILGRSAQSRLGRVIVVKDLTKEEALRYLCHQHGKHRDIAEAVYDFTGGRIAYLKSALTQLNSGIPVLGIRQQFLDTGRDVFTKAKCMPDDEFKLVAIPLARKMLLAGAISREDFEEGAGSQTTAKRLLAVNIFTLSPYSELVVFDSKPIQLVAQEVVGNAAQRRRSWLWLW